MAKELTNKQINIARDRIMLSVKETAKKQGISPATVNSQSDAILYKLHVSNIKEAIHKLTKAGLLVLTACTLSFPAPTERMNNRRRAPTPPVVVYRLVHTASAGASI